MHKHPRVMKFKAHGLEKFASAVWALGHFVARCCFLFGVLQCAANASCGRGQRDFNGVWNFS